MRLGKPVENLQGALRAYYGAGPPAEQITTIAKQLSYFGYLSHDALVWVRPRPALHYRRLLYLPYLPIGKYYQILQPST